MLTAHDVRRVAVAAVCDERTVRRRLRGKHVQSTSATRIDAALVGLGFGVVALNPPRPAPQSSAPAAP